MPGLLTIASRSHDGACGRGSALPQRGSDALEKYFRGLGASSLVVAGCNLPNCTRATLPDASCRDFRLALATDAVSRLEDRDYAQMTNIGVALLGVEGTQRSPHSGSAGRSRIGQKARRCSPRRGASRPRHGDSTACRYDDRSARRERRAARGARGIRAKRERRSTAPARDSFARFVELELTRAPSTVFPAAWAPRTVSL